MTTPQPARRARFDRFELDLGTGELWRDGEAVDLPPQPARILALLVARSGRLVERSELRERIWGESWLDWEAALHQAVRRVRVALHDSASEPRYIETLPRRGYRFIAPLQVREPASEPAGSARSPTLARALAVGVAGIALLVAFLASGAGQRGPLQPVAAEARRLHTEGLHLLGRGEIEPALGRFRSAAVAAPGWAAPWSAVAEAELNRGDGNRVERARQALERALSRDAEDAHAWRLVARLRLWEEWDWLGARSALDHAARAAPDNADVWQLIAALETVLEREEHALAASRRALELDPISTGRRVDLGWTFYYFGHGEKALRECRRGLDLSPESVPARGCVLQALILLGRRSEAAEWLSSGREIAGEDAVLEAHYRRQLTAIGSPGSCASSAAAAIPRFVLGDRPGALAALVAAADEGRGWELPFARVDPLLAPLRAEAEFALAVRALEQPIEDRG